MMNRLHLPRWQGLGAVTGRGLPSGLVTFTVPKTGRIVHRSVQKRLSTERPTTASRKALSSCVASPQPSASHTHCSSTTGTPA